MRYRFLRISFFVGSRAAFRLPRSQKVIIEVRLSDTAIQTTGAGVGLGAGIFYFACVLVVSFGVDRHWYVAGMCALLVLWTNLKATVGSLCEVPRVLTDGRKASGIFPLFWEPRDWKREETLKQVAQF